MTIENNQIKTNDDFFKIRDLLRLCVVKWHWFVLSLVLSLLLAFVYLKITPEVYERHASVLIKEDSKGNSVSSDISGLSDLGLFQSNTNVNNEVVSLRSHSLMLETVNRLRLNVEYNIRDNFHDIILYGSTLPVNVQFEGAIVPEEGRPQEFVITLLDGGTVRLSDFCVGGDDCEDESVIEGNLLDTLRTPIGKIIVAPTAHYNGQWEFPVEVTRIDPPSVARRFSKNLNVGLSGKETSIVDLRLTDVSGERAEDVLNTLIAIYNENWVEDKNRMAVSTSKFISERLSIIEQELGDVDANIASFKSENLVPDVAAASAMYMSRSKEVADQLQSQNNRLQMARYILRYMADNTSGNQLLPASSGIESSAIEGQIAEYNDMLLKRNNLVANSSEQNPLVVDLDQSLAALRRTIVASVENYTATLEEQIKGLQTLARQTTSQISANPAQAKDLLTVERQQMVKEALYLFLLQKREENELSQTFAANNTRIVQVPTGSLEPSAPVARNILAVAVLMGLLIPVAVIFLRENLNTRVRGRKDLEELSVPLIGEIPLLRERRKGLRAMKKRPATEEIVVKSGKRDIVNEAFRVLRTNLEFMTGQGQEKSERSNVIAITSFNAGSGKSFIAANIAVSLTLKGRKVLIVDGDLRHASTSKLVDSPKKGLSDLLWNGAADPKEYVVADWLHPGLHVLPVGTIPPNPTELLEGGRMADLISALRERYDYILIDCPPVDIVADTQIIEKQADRTVFVVRTGLLERSLLPELEGFYSGKRFKNLTTVLNATPENSGRYGYRYGYHNGYYQD